MCGIVVSEVNGLTPLASVGIIPANLNHDAIFMTQQKLDKFRERLDEEKTRLLQELQDFGKEDPTRPGHFAATYPESGSNSEDDNAAEISEYADDMSVEARLEEELRDVENALKALDAGKYGVCKYCNQPIDEKRLEARPSSSSCVSCKKILTQEL
jgi:DnaK suppressor protein